MSSHQEQEYAQLQSARPCDGRGELELQKVDKPATPCCKAKTIVNGASFDCSILNRKIRDLNFCWSCTYRKSS